jgi:hypothetical protein
MVVVMLHPQLQLLFQPLGLVPLPLHGVLHL